MVQCKAGSGGWWERWPVLPARTRGVRAALSVHRPEGPSLSFQQPLQMDPAAPASRFAPTEAGAQPGLSPSLSLPVLGKSSHCQTFKQTRQSCRVPGEVRCFLSRRWSGSAPRPSIYSWGHTDAGAHIYPSTLRQTCGHTRRTRSRGRALPSPHTDSQREEAAQGGQVQAGGLSGGPRTARGLRAKGIEHPWWSRGGWGRRALGRGSE